MQRIVGIFLVPMLMFFSTISAQLKVLHLSFHRGCISDFTYVAKQLDLDLTSIFIHDLPTFWWDETIAGGSALYSVGHDRAQRIWEKHKDFFNQFDLILTSDTAPLSRIFLQNNWKKPLIIWVCNRFDYCDEASKDCHFPDPEYYQLFRDAVHRENVRIIAYTPFEHYYARLKGVNTGTQTIKPCAKPKNSLEKSSIPGNVNKSESFFIPPYHNDTIFLNLAEVCTNLGIPVYNGRYAGPGDLKDFKGIIHIPYAWSNLALFENLQNGVPYFIPSRRFMLELSTQNNFFFNMLSPETIDYSEWYLPENSDAFIYFDSWADLAVKIQNTNFAEVKERSQRFAEKNHETMLSQWRDLFMKLCPNQKM